MRDAAPPPSRLRLPWRRLALLIAVAAYAWWRPPLIDRLPPSWTPWTPLDIDAAPDRWTRMRLDRLASDPVACLDALSDARGAFRVLPDRGPDEGCSQLDAVSVRRLQARVEPFPLTCRAAVSLALWERHVLQPAARRHFDAGVGRIEHFGSYACRNVYGRAAGRRSQHATADAFDVAGFVLEDGRRIRVVDGWQAGGPTGAFLREVHRGACAYFDAVLGPEYNAAHRDHLHLDRGPFRACR